MPQFQSEEEAIQFLRSSGLEEETPTFGAETEVTTPSRFATEEEARAALAGSLQAQTEPPSVPQSLTGFLPSAPDPLAGVDVESGGDMGLRARAAFQVSDEGWGNRNVRAKGNQAR